MVKRNEILQVKLAKIVGGGQALGTLPDGRKLFAWGGLPGELVNVQVTKKKSNFVEGIVAEVLEQSPERVAPRDPDSYLSTSPWQIMAFEAEQRHKSALIEEAFTLHGVTLHQAPEVYTDAREFHYRNKVEFSWYSDTDTTSGVDTLDLAFFRRGSKGKIIVNDSALLPPEITTLARAIRDTLHSAGITARQLKTLLIRCDTNKNCVWQLYVKDTPCDFADLLLDTTLPAQGGEVIYSYPKSPASVVTERLGSTGDIVLKDTILGVPFRYATEGFFQVNIPVYEQALKDMKEWVATDTATPQPSFSSGALSASESSVLLRSAGKAEPSEKEVTSGSSLSVPADSDLRSEAHDGSGDRNVLDLYSGVGSIGLTIGGPNVTLVEINEHAVREMKRNIEELGIQATPVLAASEKALEYISSDSIVIVDPPRAGLHTDVIERMLEVKPPRIVYLSCNPVTQARDTALLLESYKIAFIKGYNFFPRTPHIEHLVVLDRKN